MSSETGKRNADRLNILGLVVVGICGAVLVYVSIALLQAFYINDTAQVEVMADYGGQDSTARSIKSEQLLHIDPPQGVRNAGGKTFSIKIDKAMDLVVRDAKNDPCSQLTPPTDPCPGAGLVPSQGPANDMTQIKPVYGRPQKIDKPADAGAGAGSGAAPAGGAGSGAPAGAGSAAGGNGP